MVKRLRNSLNPLGKFLFVTVFGVIGLFLIVAATIFNQRAHATSAASQVGYYTTTNNTISFSRSLTPMNTTSGGSTVSQTANSDGSVTLNINNTTGYSDSGFYLNVGTLGSFKNALITGPAGSAFGLNIWFDKDNNGEYFVWNNSNVLTGLGNDSYILSSGTQNGTLFISTTTAFTSMNPGGGNYTLAQLQSGAAPGITSSTKIALWVGINTSSGSLQATVNSLDINVHLAPTITSISPVSAAIGGPNLALTVNGTGFDTSSTVQINGVNRVTTFVNSTQLTATILAADIAAVGTASITVVNPAPGGGTSNAQTLTIITSAYGTDFESFALGDVQNQDGWTSGHGSSFCPLYDVAVVSNTYGYASFGGKSLRISNAITCGSFNDQTFSKSLVNEAGETAADTSVYSGGTRQPYFEAQWDFASTQPGSEQPGLSVVASPDRGDPGRMSWVQMQDTPTGLQVNFEEYSHSIMDFVLTPIATGLDRTVPHTIKITMQFIDGAGNDIVKVYVDGTLVHTGTSWEDYFRDFEVGVPHPVDSIMFRVAGTAAPANLGKGFIIDNFSSLSGPVPVPASPPSSPAPAPSPVSNSVAPGQAGADFEGQAYPGSTIKVLRKSEVTGPYESIPLTSVSVADDGSFKITVLNFLSARYFFALQATDKDGRESRILPIISQFIPTGSNLTIKDILIPPTTELGLSVIPSDQPVKIFGYAAPSSVVEISIDDASPSQTTSDASGFYTFSTSTAQFPLTDHTIKARFILPSGTKSDFSLAKSFVVSTRAGSIADLSGNKSVTVADWSIFLSRWNSTDENIRKTIDFNHDGKIDISDLSIFLNAFQGAINAQ